MRTRWVVLVWCLLFGAGSSSPGFADPGPCGGGSEIDTPIDRLIRGDPELAGLDRQMAATYGAAIAVHRKAGNADRARRLEESQGEWEAALDECVSTANPVDCVRNRYELRIAKLQVEYAMVPEQRRVIYSCDGDPPSRLVAVHFATDRPTVRLERENESVIASLFRSRLDPRYLTQDGVIFRTGGDEATIEWPRGSELHCRVLDAE